MRSSSASKVDANQPGIVESLRKIGASVQPLNRVGDGCPDLLVGYRNRNYLIEIKNLEGRGCKLTPDQVVWHGQWTGQKAIACTFDECKEIIMGRTHDGCGQDQPA